MVSFSCEGCGDVLTKKKLDSHRNQCRAAFSCLDCMVTFHGTDYRSHTSCISEAQKYEKALYKEKKGKKQNSQNMNVSEPTTPAVLETTQAIVPVNVFHFQVAEPDNRVAIVDAPPPAPSPPPMINVFDFMVENVASSRRSTSPVDGVDYAYNGYPYGGEKPPPYHSYTTPAPDKGHSRNISTESAAKKGSKRKRAHVDEIDVSTARRFPPNGDVIMTDVPPVMHSGLTGGLHRMLRPEFPPSPDYSGGDNPATSPSSPLKKAKGTDKESSKSKERKKSSSLSKSKDKDRKEKKERSGEMTKERTPKKSKTSSSKVGGSQWVQVRKRTGEKEKPMTSTSSSKAIKAIEYDVAASEDADASALIVHPERNGATIRISGRAEAFMSFVTKGPEHDKGCSINKALKRYHRERGDRVSKLTEEKELWKVLRLKRNDRGEIVLFPAEA